MFTKPTKEQLERLALIPVVALLAVLCFSTPAARAQTQITDNWINGTGFWNNAANWDSGIPNDGGGNYFDVVLNSPGNTITFNASPTVVDTLTVGSGTTLQSFGTPILLTIGDATSPFANTGTVVNNGDINAQNGSAMTINGNFNNGPAGPKSLGLVLGGASTLTVNGNFTNQSSILWLLGSGNKATITGAFTSSGAASAGSDFEVDTGSTLTAGSWSNLDGSGKLTGWNTQYTMNGGLFKYSGSDILNNVNPSIYLIKNGGSSAKDAIGSTVLISHDNGVTSALDNLNTNGGSIALDSGSVQNLNGGLTNTGGLVLFDGSSMTTNCAFSAKCAHPGATGGDLTNGGSSHRGWGSVFLSNEGGGGSTLTVNGNYEQAVTWLNNSGSTLKVTGNFTDDAWVTVDTGSAIKVAGTLANVDSLGNLTTISPGASYNLNGGTLFYTGNAVTNIGSGVAVTLSNYGGLSADGTGSTIMFSADKGVTSAFDYMNTINGSLTLNNNLIQNVSGPLTVGAGGGLTIENSSSMTTGGDLSTAGTVNVQQSSTLAVTGALTNSGTINTGNGVMDAGSNAVNVSGQLINNGTISLGGWGWGDSLSAAGLTNAGAINLNNFAQLTASDFANKSGGSLTLSSSWVSVAGDFNNNSGASLGITNGIISEVGGAFNNGGTVMLGGAMGGISVGGAFNNNGGSLIVGVEVGGVSVGGDFNNNSGGSVIMAPDVNFLGVGGDFNNSSGASLALLDIWNRVGVGGTFNNNGGTVMLGGDGDSLYAGTFNNNGGTLTLSGYGNTLSANSFNNTGGSVFVGNGEGVNVTNAYTQAGAGASTKVNGTLTATLTSIQGGTLSGSGTIVGDVNNSGGNVIPIDPGNPTTLTINGNYTQGPNGTLTIDLSGTGSGDFSVLAVTGNATLDGAVDFTAIGGFKPVAGDDFTFLTFGSESGNFANIDFTGWNCVQCTEVFGANSLTLEVNRTPEPSIFLLLVMGIATMTILLKYRSTARSGVA